MARERPLAGWARAAVRSLGGPRRSTAHPWDNVAISRRSSTVSSCPWSALGLSPDLDAVSAPLCQRYSRRRARKSARQPLDPIGPENQPSEAYIVSNRRNRRTRERDCRRGL